MREDLIHLFRCSDLRFVASITGGGTGFISEYLAIPGASRSFLEAVVPYSPESMNNILGFQPEKSCSERTARQLAVAAYERARRLSANPDDPQLIGIGATAALASDRPKKGDHRMFCAICARFGFFCATLNLTKDARSRREEETLAADFILSTLLFATRRRPEASAPVFVWRETRAPLDLQTAQQLLPGDSASVAWTSLDETSARFLFDQDKSEQSVAAMRWKNGAVDILLLTDGTELKISPADFGRPFAPLLRRYRRNASKSKSGRTIFPGSFNPFHRGHARIAEVGSARTSKRVELELSVRNVDKPPLDPLEILGRIRSVSDSAPETPVWATNAPQFVNKAGLFPNATFLLGADTITRLGDPKYAHDSIEERDAILDRLRERGARFQVFARREKNGELLEPAEIRDRLPEKLVEMCNFVDAAEFLEDVSSTELRRKANEHSLGRSERN